MKMAFFELRAKLDHEAAEITADEQSQDTRFVYAPELVPGTGPELVPGIAPEVVPKISDCPQLVKDENDSSNIISSVRRPSQPRRTIIAFSVVACLLVVGLAVGLGVGLNANKSSSSDQGESRMLTEGDPTGGTKPSAHDNKTLETNGGGGADPTIVSCPGGLCQNILSLSIYEGDLLVVARDTQNRVTIRPVDTGLWEDPFVDLGETPGKLISQPSSFSWKVNDTWSRLDIFAVSSPDFTVYRRHYSETEDWTAWEQQGTDIGSPVVICGAYPDTMDVWASSKSRQTIFHDWWSPKSSKNISKSATTNGNTSEYGKMSEGENGWKEESNLGHTRSAPAVVCRASAIHLDLFWYDRTQNGLLHSGWNQTREEWTTNTGFVGNFIGSPTVFSFGHDEWDFFGVQANKKLYHLSWKSTNGGYSQIKSLEGSIASVPTAVSLKEGSLDVFALGTNGNLQHIHYDGQEWTKWEDLEIQSSSAPSAIVHNMRVHVMIVSVNGSMISCSRLVDDAAKSWKGLLEQEVVGNNISLQYFWYTA